MKFTLWVLSRSLSALVEQIDGLQYEFDSSAEARLSAVLVLRHLQNAKRELNDLEAIVAKRDAQQ